MSITVGFDKTNVVHIPMAPVERIIVDASFFLVLSQAPAFTSEVDKAGSAPVFKQPQVDTLNA